MHTDSSLSLLESLTAEFGLLMGEFQELTCSQFSTTELPREAASRKRRNLKKTAAQSSETTTTSQAPTLEHPTTESVENIIAPTENHAAIRCHPIVEPTANTTPPVPTPNSSGKNHMSVYTWDLNNTSHRCAFLFS